MRFQKLILAMGTFGAASGAMLFCSAASAAIDPIDAISICSRISKKESRLECYDGIAKDAMSGRLSSAPSTPSNWGAPPPPRAQAPAPAPAPFAAPPAPTTGFGATEKQEGPDSISVQVASATDSGLEQWRIKMADGSIWQMTERTPLFRPPAPQETVTIRKAALGGFLMDVGKQASVRVRRIQ